MNEVNLIKGPNKKELVALYEKKEIVVPEERSHGHTVEGAIYKPERVPT